ncbi:MAG: CoA transferase [Actinomycetota bacterium]|nr:CoA transferase [Actinomycetota bacterium]
MGVLDGINVLEVAEQGFVPSAAAILAEWGADVIKVERPTGDPLRHYAKLGVVPDVEGFNILFETFNRNKRSIAIDLRNDDGRAALDGLITWADVFITSFLPSARTNLRLHPDDIWAVNPRCVFAIGSGQGLKGPDADMGGFDAVSFWARGGLGHILTTEGADLVQPRGALGDAPSGAYLAGGVAGALVKQARTGEPSVVDVSLLGAAVWTLSIDLVSTAATGVEAKAHAAGQALSGTVLIGSYRTADNRWLSLNMLDQDRHWEPTCRALGLHDLIGPDYETSDLRQTRTPELHARFTEAIHSQQLDELKQQLAGHDTIYSSHASPNDVIADPQVEANGYMPAVPGHPTARLTSSPMQFDGKGLEIRSRAPEIGEHTDDVLREVGFDPAEIARLRAVGAVGATA